MKEETPKTDSGVPDEGHMKHVAFRIKDSAESLEMLFVNNHGAALMATDDKGQSATVLLPEQALRDLRECLNMFLGDDQ